MSAASSRPLRGALAFGAALATLGAASAARAEPVITFEPRTDIAVPAGDVRPGPGLGVAAGYASDLYPILLVPELVLSGAVYPGDATFGTFRATAGGRAGFTASVEPAVFVHGGYGMFGGGGTTSHGFAFDAGASLDKRIDRGFTLGGALAYQAFFGDGSVHGLTAAFRIGLWL